MRPNAHRISSLSMPTIWGGAILPVTVTRGFKLRTWIRWQRRVRTFISSWWPTRFARPAVRRSTPGSTLHDTACISTSRRINKMWTAACRIGFRPSASLPRMLRAAGYRTAHYGKWHLSGGGIQDAPLPAAYGYDDAAVYNGPGQNVFEGSDIGKPTEDEASFPERCCHRPRRPIYQGIRRQAVSSSISGSTKPTTSCRPPRRTASPIRTWPSRSKPIIPR